MIYHTSRSDLEPYIKAAHDARSRAFFDLLNWIGSPFAKAWSAVKLTIIGGLHAAVKTESRPSGAMHA